MARTVDDRETGSSVAEIRAARRRAEQEASVEPRAASARYDGGLGHIVIELTSGCVFSFAPSEADGLRGATPAQLAAVEVLAGGEGLHWEELDADISVPGVIAHRLNLAQWAPKLMGRRTSPAKSAASRANGAKGGRPRRGAM